MKKKFFRFLLIPGALLLLILAFFFVFPAYYHVGATDRHTRPVEWVLKTTMRQSIRQHARDIQVPDTLDLLDPQYARQFYGHYSAACRSCHGAPGQKPDPWMVIYPEAPDLTSPAVVGQWTDAELFWILKHGIKDTGMMALGPTHSDADIWGVTALVRQLPQMSPEEYTAMAAWFEEMQAHKGHGDPPTAR